MFAIRTSASHERNYPRHPGKQLEACQGKKQRHDIVAQAVFTSQQIKELPLVQTSARFALLRAPLAQLAKNFLVRHGRGNRRNRNAKNG
jgi:hypothetical protein